MPLPVQAAGAGVGCLATANSLVDMVPQFDWVVPGALSGKDLLDLLLQAL